MFIHILKAQTPLDSKNFYKNLKIMSNQQAFMIWIRLLNFKLKLILNLKVQTFFIF